MPLRRIALLLILLLATALPVYAQDWISHRPDGHAPIMVMGNHTHGKGEFMLSYRYMNMTMQGSRVGTDAVSDAVILSPSVFRFRVTPTEMPTQMHMFGAMYAPSNSLTLVAMIPHISSEMTHITRAGGSFATSSSGWGDIRVTALYVVARPVRARLRVGLGVSIPAGSIQQSGTTPLSQPDEVQLPYRMQLGSGTLDILPSLTYLSQLENLSFGLQVGGVYRLSRNDNDYRLGHVARGTFWAAYRLSDMFSASVRIAGKSWGNIDGFDRALSSGAQAPTQIPSLQGGTRFDGGVGINYFTPSGPLHNLRFGAEVMFPVFQDLNGPQLEVDLLVQVGVQYAFGGH